MFLGFRFCEEPWSGGQRRGLCDIDRVIFRLNQLSKNRKSWHGENIPIIIQNEKAELSVYFFRTRTSQ